MRAHRYQLGSGEASIRSKVKVNDGLKHNVTAHRRGREGSLIVDGEEVSGHSAGFLQMLNVRGHLYLGKECTVHCGSLGS